MRGGGGGEKTLYPHTWTFMVENIVASLPNILVALPTNITVPVNQILSNNIFHVFYLLDIVVVLVVVVLLHS